MLRHLAARGRRGREGHGAKASRRSARRSRLVALGEGPARPVARRRRGLVLAERARPGLLLAGAERRGQALPARGLWRAAPGELEDGSKVPLTPGRQAVAEALDQLEAIAHRGRAAPAGAARRRRRRPAGARPVPRRLLGRRGHRRGLGGGQAEPARAAPGRGDATLAFACPGRRRRARRAARPARLRRRRASDVLDARSSASCSPRCARSPPYFVLVLDGEQGSGKTTTVQRPAHAGRSARDRHPAEAADRGRPVRQRRWPVAHGLRQPSSP